MIMVARSRDSTGAWIVLVGAGEGSFVLKVRIKLVELPRLAIGAPAQVTVARLSQINVREIFETARPVEARGQFVGDRLIVDEAVGARRADGLFVEPIGVELAALDARNLGADQRGAVLEILRAVPPRL